MSAFDLPPIDEPQPGLLDQLLAEAYPALSQVQSPGPPQSFLEGLGQGFVGGLASRGQRVARQRALFEERQRQRQAAVDQARITQATAAANRAGTLSNEQQLAQEKFNRENPELTPEDIAAFPAGTTGARLKPGTRLSISERTKLLGEETPADKQARIKAEHKAMAEGSQAGEGNSTLMDPQTLRFYADREIAGGNPPNLGRGSNGEANRTAYNDMLRKVAEERGLTGADVGANRVIQAAERANLTNLQRGYGVVEQQAQTLSGNLKTLETSLAKVPDLGSPFFNAIARPAAKRFFGNTEVTNFNASLTPVRTEAARILNAGLSGGGALSVDARHELESIAGSDFTGAQLRGVIKIIRQDLANRRKGLQTEIGSSQERLRHIGQPAQPEPAPGGRVVRDPVTHKLVRAQ